MQTKQVLEAAKGAVQPMGGFSGCAYSVGSTLLSGIVGVALGGVWGGLAGLAAPVGLMFLYHLARQDTIAVRAENKRLKEALASAAHSVAPFVGAADETAPDRDWTIGDLFRFIRADVVEVEKWKEVGAEIRQALADGKLRIWGQSCDEDGLHLDAFTDPPILEKIAANRWRNASFSYQFFEGGTQNNCHVTIREGALIHCFCNLRVNSEEAKKAFQRFGPDPSQGTWKAGEFIYHSPRQVLTTRLNAPQDDCARFNITLYDIPPLALVRFRVQFEPDNQYWMGDVRGHAVDETKRAEMGEQRLKLGRTGSSRLDDKSQAHLTVWTTRPDAASVIARVLVQSWTLRDDVQI